jgi:hypothetical protein
MDDYYNFCYYENCTTLQPLGSLWVKAIEIDDYQHLLGGPKALKNIYT